ncbi:hypothetical protein [Shewanella dokdonensis]|uniref:Uncharacterized protein n=1 Tax=Shewanella dokdonensis TaxID=712036 RepID=A0ABX8DES3_9GAMM|nr:hypothetical protein [Shewanella dokdonensis]MCL1076014.1 hypothetical protein [Shewanella dokdonensis]QVK23238.1 hypothetical protein KHX94_19750 [Shewanella dokdonensis]
MMMRKVTHLHSGLRLFTHAGNCQHFSNTDVALLYLNLRLELDPLPLRQRWLQLTDSYHLRRTLTRLQRLHSGIAGSLLRFTGLAEQSGHRWPSLPSVLMWSPPLLAHRYRILKQQPLSMPPPNSHAFRLALWRLEQDVASWHRRSVAYCESASVSALLADMAAARQLSLDSVFPVSDQDFGND